LAFVFNGGDFVFRERDFDSRKRDFDRLTEEKGGSAGLPDWLRLLTAEPIT
jgi:hypothetical protein